MTVYVDDYRQHAEVSNGGRIIRGRWSHLLATTEPELVAFARRLGLAPRWIQHPGEPTVHFDVTEPMRERAIGLGAQPITWRESGEIVRARRDALRALAAAAPAPAPVDVAQVDEPVDEPVPVPALPGDPPAPRCRWNAATTRHAWWHYTEHWYHCLHCSLYVWNREKRGGYFKMWGYPEWPERLWGSNRHGGPVASCPGPGQKVKTSL